MMTLEKPKTETETDTMATYFELNTPLIAIMYMCYEYKMPVALMIAFYESYTEMALYLFKAMACMKYVTLTDAKFKQIVEESRKLYWQIVDHRVKVEEFSPEFQQFINTYLMVNIEDIYAERIKLNITTKQLYGEK